MSINYQKQHSLGLAGLALLRNWLIGREKSIESILEEISDISKTSNYVTDIDNKKVIGFDVKDGYKVWVSSYDKSKNLLIEVEEPIVKSILEKLPLGSALDAACGTGRYSVLLKNFGNRVTGVDFSPEMLSVARQEVKNVNFVESDLNKLPFDSNSFDIVLCGLGLNQMNNVNDPIREFARVARLGGKVIISSLHPVLIALGVHAEFPDENGNLAYIENTAHWTSEYVNCFNKYGLRIIQCVEPKIERKHLDTAQAAFSLSKKTVSKALVGLPVAMIWELEKS